MDSINRQQPEQNRKDLSGAEAAKKIKDLAESAQTCFFITKIQTGGQPSARPMSPQKVDEQGNFWFLSANDSHKNAELASDPNVQLLFQGSKHSDFLSVFGKATITEDKQKIKELWDPILKVWFTEGENDPRISVIKVEPSQSYYWDNKHGDAVAFVKMAAGAIIGQTLDDSVEGSLRV